MSVVSAHVSSCPNHQTLRVTPLETRFHVAAFGLCGYECNLGDMKEEERAAVKHRLRFTRSGGMYSNGAAFIEEEASMTVRETQAV